MLTCVFSTIHREEGRIDGSLEFRTTRGSGIHEWYLGVWILGESASQSADSLRLRESNLSDFRWRFGCYSVSWCPSVLTCFFHCPKVSKGRIDWSWPVVYDIPWRGSWSHLSNLSEFLESELARLAAAEWIDQISKMKIWFLRCELRWPSCLGFSFLSIDIG